MAMNEREAVLSVMRKSLSGQQEAFDVCVAQVVALYKLANADRSELLAVVKEFIQAAPKPSRLAEEAAVLVDRIEKR